MQRHHLLPCAALHCRSLAAMVERLGSPRVGMEDFCRNGMLLPAREQAAVRTALPLHRGPHGAYSAMVIERLGEIESRWSRTSGREPEDAGAAALAAIERLRMQLRVQLLDRRQPLRLNRHDPLCGGTDFTQLDALAELLWRGTG